jgi:hypothetical protein
LAEEHTDNAAYKALFVLARQDALTVFGRVTRACVGEASSRHGSQDMDQKSGIEGSTDTEAIDPGSFAVL